MKPARISASFYFAFLAMELSYLYILASLLKVPTYALVLILLLYPVALFSKVVVARSAFPQRLRFALEMSLIAVVVLLVTGGRLASSLATGQVDVPSIVLRMGICGLAWLVGHTVPDERVNYPTIAFRLQMGILAVLVFGPVVGSAPPVLLFFLLAPPALFLARWASSLSRGANPLRSPNPSHLVLAAASIVVPGTTLVLLFSPSVAGAIVKWLRNISTTVNDWVMAQHKAASTLPGGFKFDFSCVGPSTGEETPPSTQPPPIPPGNGSTISNMVDWIIIVVISLVIIALIAFILRRRTARRKAQHLEPVPFEIRLVSSNLLHSFIALFLGMLNRLRLWLTLVLSRWGKRSKPSEEPFTSIRALYRNLLRWAAKRGVARLPSQTPLEYLVVLEQGFPQQQGDLRQITDAYLVARYSQKTLSEDCSDAARQAWQRIATHRARTAIESP